MSALDVSLYSSLRFPYLDHLNKRDTEIKIGQISAYQTQAEEDADGHNGAQVHAPGHLDRFAAIE